MHSAAPKTVINDRGRQGDGFGNRVGRGGRGTYGSRRRETRILSGGAEA